MEPRLRIGRNLDTCQRGPPLIKFMGYEHREDAFGGGKAGNGKHTHTHTVTHVGVAPQIKLMSYEHREDAVEGGGSRQWQRHTNTHTHTYTHSVHCDSQGGWSLG